MQRRGGPSRETGDKIPTSTALAWPGRQLVTTSSGRPSASGGALPPLLPKNVCKLAALNLVLAPAVLFSLPLSAARCTLHAPCTTPWHSFSGSPRALRRDTFNLNAPTLTTPGPKKIQKPSEPTYSWTAFCGTLVIKYSNIENARPSSGVPQPRVSSVGLPKPKPDPPAPLPCGQP